jgi:hypothetical protein
MLGCGILASFHRAFLAVGRTDITAAFSSSRRASVDAEYAYDYRLQQQQQQQQQVLSNKNIAVFYNLYVNASSDEELLRVADIVSEQFGYFQPWHQPIFVHSIGQQYPIPNTTLLQHHQQATEMVTLRSLWEYCRQDENANASVAYLHSKGSYHPSPLNDRLRKFNSLGALSDDCSKMPDTCNVCSSRFSPFPHPHTPGNMWQAKCSYVQHLVDPAVFANDMDLVKRRTIGNIAVHPSCLGAGRFAAEHWIHSHPYVQPCDLYTNPRYGWGYEKLEEFQGMQNFELALGPRFERSDWRVGCPYSDLQHRLNEYQLLYDMVPGDDWWGWEFWMEEA